MRTRSASLLVAAGLALVGAGCGSASAKTGVAAAGGGATAAAASGATTTDLAAAKKAAEGAIAQQGGDDDGGGRDGGGRAGGGPGGPFGGLDAAAKAIGVSVDELQADVTGGQTIAQVAAAKGVGVDTVVNAMVASMKAHFDGDVASGEHTQAEEDQQMANAAQTATAIVNGQQPAFGPGDRGGDGGGDGGGAPDQAVGSAGRKAQVLPTTTVAG